MQRTFQITLFAAAFTLLAACGSAPTVIPVPTVSLDSPIASETRLVKASGVVVPARDSRLSFVISGIVEEVTVAAGERVQAGQALARLDTTGLEYDITEAQAALSAAELDLEIQQQRRKVFNFDRFNFEYVSVPGEVIQQAKSIVDQKRFALEAVKASLAQGTLVAPFDGTVVKVEVSPGEYVQPGQVVMTISNLERLQVETTDLSELNVAAVQVDQPATVFVEALNQEFPGKVTAVSPISDTIGGDVVFKVTIELDKQPKDLLWGMSADVQINVK